jgi:protein phosphatase
VGAVAYEKGDIFLLCTDGLTGGLYDATLLESLRANTPPPGDNLARSLVEAAVERDGKDNTTALVIQPL